MPGQDAPVGELALIETIRRRVLRQAHAGGELRLGIGDDCAILRPRAGEELVVTTDFSLEGRHFRRDWHSAESIGHRTLARGLSDLAAMGARPVAAFLSLALPKSVAADRRWIGEFLDGLLALASRFKVPLAGGDTSESPSEHVLADIVLLGAVPRGKALRRTGARPGDGIYVTGSLGGSAAELMLLAKGEVKAAGLKPDGEAHPHLFPEPRLDAGQALVRRKLATAGMDISDGLSTDLRHLCEASGVAAEVQTEALPLDPLASGEGDEAALRLALHGGEDYQLLFTARPSAKVPRQLGGVRLTRIGQITDRKRGRSLVTLVQQNGRRVDLARGGWEHLR